MKMSWKRWLGFGLCAAIAIAAVVYAVVMTTNRSRSEAAYAELLAQAQEAEPTPAPTPTPSATPEPTATPEPRIPVEDPLTLDFASLAETNADIYAWLDIPGTSISYPLLQSETDDYYLLRNLDGSSGYPGCLYTNCCDAKDFSGYNTVIYGHNMRDGSMFGSLHKFFDETYFSEHRQLIIYTPDDILVYKTLAASVFDNLNITWNYDYYTDEGREAFLDTVKERSVVWAEDVEAGADSWLITLNTCTDTGDDRNIVLAVYEGRGEAAS